MKRYVALVNLYATLYCIMADLRVDYSSFLGSWVIHEENGVIFCHNFLPDMFSRCLKQASREIYRYASPSIPYRLPANCLDSFFPPCLPVVRGNVHAANLNNGTFATA